MPTPFDSLAESIRMGRDQTNQRIEDLAASTSANIDRLAAEIEKLTLNVAQTNSGINELKGMIRQLTTAMERQNAAIDGHLQVSQQQAQNIAELTKLVASQAATADKLIQKLVA